MGHLDQLRVALDRERAAQEAEHAELSRLPLAARRAIGFSLFPLTLHTTELRSRWRVNVVLRGDQLGGAFTAGDPVLLAPLGKPDVGMPARVEGAAEHELELRVADIPDGPGPWCVSRRLDFARLEDMQAALVRAERLTGPLVGLLLGHESPWRPDPLEHPALARLNPSQRSAAELVLGTTEIGLLHGPPGTGKTETLVAILRALRDLGERPWALAESNAAVDHLALRASDAGLDVVRLGVSARIGSEVQKLTLEWRILNGARAEVIRGLMRQASRTTGPEGWELRDAIREEWAVAKREILASADVLAMTLDTLATRGRSLPVPRTAVVDEASQVMEPALWPLVGRVKRLLLAGDPLQLGPIVKSRDPLLDRSLLGRLVDAGFHFPMLETQYRMNDELLALCAPTYGGRLRSDPSVATAAHHPAAEWIDTAGMGYDEETDGVKSWHNPGELALLRKVWSALEAEGVRPEDVAVVTPYRGQVQRIQAALPRLAAGTINAFQGRERRVVLASFVRSNTDQQLGFVADPRRLNVTVTRARERFIAIGDSATLGASPHYQRVIDTIAAGGGYRSGWEMAD
jgi:hypothetical protein